MPVVLVHDEVADREVGERRERRRRAGTSGRRSARRRAPKISASVSTTSAERRDRRSPPSTRRRRSPSGSGAVDGAATIGASTSCSRRIWRRCSAWRSSAATSRTVKPSARQRAERLGVSWSKRPVKRGTSWVSSTCSARGAGEQLQLDAGPVAQHLAQRPAARAPPRRSPPAARGRRGSSARSGGRRCSTRSPAQREVTR